MRKTWRAYARFSRCWMAPGSRIPAFTT